MLYVCCLSEKRNTYNTGNKIEILTTLFGVIYVCTFSEKKNVREREKDIQKEKRKSNNNNVVTA